MPQLDKYIFFNQIVYLTFFFFLIYAYIRGTVIPVISTTLKYRKKKAYFLLSEIDSYSKLLASSKDLLDKRGKAFVIFLSEKLNNLNNFYQKETLKQQTTLNNKLFFFVKNSTEPSNSIFQNKIELNRLESITK